MAPERPGTVLGSSLGAARRSWALRRPENGLSSLVPLLWSSRFRGQVRDTPPRSGLLNFHTIKGIFFRLRSAGFDVFSQGPQALLHVPLFYLLLIHVYGVAVWYIGAGESVAVWYIGAGGECSGLVHSKPLNPRRSVENSGSGSSGLDGVPRGSDLVSLPRAVTVSERATGAAGTGRMARRVESQGRLPASRSRGRATRF